MIEAIVRQSPKVRRESLRLSIHTSFSWMVGMFHVSSGVDLIELVVEGRYAVAMAQAASETLPDAEPGESLASWAIRARAFISEQTQEPAKHGLSLLILGVSALLGFTQANLVGPDAITSSVSGGRADTSTGEGCTTLPELISASVPDDWVADQDPWVLGEIQADGEDLVCGRVAALDLLLLARLVLWEPLKATYDQSDSNTPSTPSTPSTSTQRNGNQSNPLAVAFPSYWWWSHRTLQTHQRTLAANSMTLKQGISLCREKVLSLVRGWTSSSSSSSPLSASCSPRLRAIATCSALQEAAHSYYVYGEDEKGRPLFPEAEQAIGLQYELTGLKCKKTIYQVDPTTTMVVRVTQAAGAHASGPMALDRISARTRPADVLGALPPGIVDLERGTHGLSGDTDIHYLPVLEPEVDGMGCLASASLLTPEQSLLLSWTVHFRWGRADEQLNTAEIQPFVEAVLSQSESHFLVRATAELQAARKECRSQRTIERGLINFEELVYRIRRRSSVGPANRLFGAFSVWFPLLPSLLKEWALLQLRYGMVGQAMEVFERQEMWEQLCACYVALEKKYAAEDLIRRRLQVTPSDPRLLTALGDLTQDHTLWEQAWEASRGRYVRAIRRLAERAHKLKDWETSASHWRTALNVNALHPEGWFALGHCYVKLGDNDEAIGAFTRCCQLAPEHGEAFNNLAALLLDQKRYQEAFLAFSEAAKLKEASWQVQENLARAAVLAEQWLPATRALQTLFNQTRGERLPLEVLRSLVTHLEEYTKVVDADKVAGLNTEDSRGRSRILTQLIGNLGGVVKKAVASAGQAASPEMWGAAAKYWTAIGETKAAKECMTKHVRGLQGAAWKRELDKFEPFAEASRNLCAAQLEGAQVALAQGGENDSASKAAAKKELGAARMHLKAVLKQAEESFSSQDLYQQLAQLLVQVQALESTLV